ncbi:hypothetical protein ALC56_03467 [Trachymyrmex septentrionalis]|uniref:Uncharacterized protein n=1 Tax=Trachymyrmex septentrionalis TaxID=34720 RepID=A0A195FQZ8_9HYME|nr:hypothetical protein ALC56_03467 [Trachymyrmex septentrionalis]
MNTGHRTDTCDNIAAQKSALNQERGVTRCLYAGSPRAAGPRDTVIAIKTHLGLGFLKFPFVSTTRSLQHLSLPTVRCCERL